MECFKSAFSFLTLHNSAAELEIYTFKKPRIQNFSFPSNIIYYFTKNPQNAKAYQKLIKTCKYFYSKKPIYVVNNLICSHTKNEWKLIIGKNFNLKIWLIGELVIPWSVDGRSNILSKIISNLYRSDLTVLHLSFLQISFDEFNFLVKSGTLEIINFNNVTVVVKFKNGDDGDATISLQTLCKYLPNIKQITYASKYKNIEKIYFPLLRNLQLFHLHVDFKFFSIDVIDKLIKEHPKADIFIRFSNSSRDDNYFSIEYKKHLQIMVDNIINFGVTKDYFPPLIQFCGQSKGTYDALFKLRRAYFQKEKSK